MYSKAKYNAECLKVADSYKKVLNSNFSEKDYVKFNKMCLKLKLIDTRHVKKIMDIVTNHICSGRSYRPIDVIVFCNSFDK